MGQFDALIVAKGGTIADQRLRRPLGCWQVRVNGVWRECGPYRRLEAYSGARVLWSASMPVLVRDDCGHVVRSTAQSVSLALLLQAAQGCLLGADMLASVEMTTEIGRAPSTDEWRALMHAWADAEARNTALFRAAVAREGRG